MNETSKMNALRKQRGYDTFFKGIGVDIGCGFDMLDDRVFTNIKLVVPYDVQHGDANTCPNLYDNYFDFVYSSHCLEHMIDPRTALANWIRICKPGGHVVVAVPHEVYYEKNLWPSFYNTDHKWSFRMEPTTRLPNSIQLPEFLYEFENAEVIYCDLILENFDFKQFWVDQTRDAAICQIEFILRKKSINTTVE